MRVYGDYGIWPIVVFVAAGAVGSWNALAGVIVLCFGALAVVEWKVSNHLKALDNRIEDLENNK